MQRIDAAAALACTIPGDVRVFTFSSGSSRFRPVGA